VTALERLGLSVAGWSEGALLTRVPSDVTVCARPTRATTKILETSVRVGIQNSAYLLPVANEIRGRVRENSPRTGLK
jgi:hypothetical protein